MNESLLEVENEIPFKRELGKTITARELGVDGDVSVTTHYVTADPSEHVPSVTETVGCIEVKNGDLEFVVMVDRGMEVLSMRYQKKNMGWETPIGSAYHPKDVDLHRAGKLMIGERKELPGIGGPLDGFVSMIWKAFPRFGVPMIDLGDGFDCLHGVASYTLPDKDTVMIKVLADREGRKYIRVTGVTRPAGFKNTTTITTKLGGHSIVYDEAIENCGMAGKHFNFAFHNQLRTGNLVMPTWFVFPRDPTKDDDLENWNRYGIPRDEPGEHCFYHHLAPVAGLRDFLLMDGEDLTATMVCEPDGSFGVYNAFSLKQFPTFTQWKVNGKWFIDHINPCKVFGSEPSNGTRPDQERFATFLNRGIVLHYTQEIGALTDRTRDMGRLIHESVGTQNPLLVYNSIRPYFEQMLDGHLKR